MAEASAVGSSGTFLAMDTEDLLTQIVRAKSACIQGGVDPDELFLGPQEDKLLRDYVEMYPSVRISEALKNEDRIFMGMKIVVCEIPGVRVGTSFPA